MPIHSLHEYFIDQPKFRVKQAKKAVYQDLIDDWSKATNFSLPLRESLNQDCPLAVEAEFFVSNDKKSVKALITLDDGQKVETVLLKNLDGRNSLCVSSQVGCQMGCKFCATGGMGFRRNLEPNEIINQVLLMARYLKASNNKITNIIFMGMGESFLNYDNVLWAINILNDAEGFNLGARHFSISTCGVIPGIAKLTKEKLQINLAVSLNAPNNKLRSKLMPINSKYSLEKVMVAVKAYIQKTNRQVMFEYLLIKDVNDSLDHAKELARLMCNNLFVVNLIPYNPTGKFQASDKKQIKIFRKILEAKGINVTQRMSFGQDIMAACGQLAAGKINQ